MRQTNLGLRWMSFFQCVPSVDCVAFWQQNPVGNWQQTPVSVGVEISQNDLKTGKFDFSQEVKSALAEFGLTEEGLRNRIIQHFGSEGSPLSLRASLKLISKRADDRRKQLKKAGTEPIKERVPFYEIEPAKFLEREKSLPSKRRSFLL